MEPVELDVRDGERTDVFRILDENDRLVHTYRGNGFYSTASGARTARGILARVYPNKTFRVQTATYAEWENI